MSLVDLGNVIGPVATMNNLSAATTLAVNTPFTAPANGYLAVFTGAAAGSAVSFTLSGKNSGQITGYEVTAALNNGSTQTLFILKDTKINVTRLDTGCAAYFYSIV